MKNKAERVRFKLNQLIQQLTLNNQKQNMFCLNIIIIHQKIIYFIKRSNKQNKFINYNKIKMYRKNQLKTFSLQKLWQLTQNHQNSDLLILIKEVIDERNSTLKQKLTQTKSELDKTRILTKKTIKQMNDQVKDILEKKEKIIMDKNSRPTQEDIKNLTQLFQFMQRQTEIIDRNNKDIQKFLQAKSLLFNQVNSQKKKILNSQEQFRQLDKEYEQLNMQVKKQSEKLNTKKSELNEFKSQLLTINETIEQYRVKYEEIQASIRERERQLDHLTTYFKNRVKEDEENIERQSQLTSMLENQLMKAQKILNFNSDTNVELRIRQIELQKVN